MPKITVKFDKKDDKVIDVPVGKRLVLALEDGGVDIAHRCGGNAKCTTCRCEIINGKPHAMTIEERDKLVSKGDLGKYRLSCQILVNHDMTVKPLMLVSEQDFDNPGKRPTDQIPEVQWLVN